jgi:hypothetical protein
MTATSAATVHRPDPKKHLGEAQTLAVMIEQFRRFAPTSSVTSTSNRLAAQHNLRVVSAAAPV